MYADEKEFVPPSVPPPNYYKATHSTTTKDEHDEIDQELLAEAGHPADFEDEKHTATEEEPDDRDLDKNLLWLKDAQRPRHGSYPRLEVVLTLFPNRALHWLTCSSARFSFLRRIPASKTLSVELGRQP